MSFFKCLCAVSYAGIVLICLPLLLSLNYLVEINALNEPESIVMGMTCIVMLTMWFSDEVKKSAYVSLMVIIPGMILSIIYETDGALFFYIIQACATHAAYVVVQPD